MCFIKMQELKKFSRSRFNAIIEEYFPNDHLKHTVCLHLNVNKVHNSFVVLHCLFDKDFLSISI